MPSWGCVSQARVSPTLHWHTESTRLAGEPSQSLSAVDVQSRSLGNTAPLQSPHSPSSEQVTVPMTQMPFSVAGPQGCVSPSVQGQSALGIPSQLSSFPGTQVSLPGLTEQSPHSP